MMAEKWRTFWQEDQRCPMPLSFVKITRFGFLKKNESEMGGCHESILINRPNDTLKDDIPFIESKIHDLIHGLAAEEFWPDGPDFQVRPL